MVSSVTPFPAVAWVRRILSPAVMTTCAWCSNRSTLALAMVLDISSSKPAGVFDALAAEALEAYECAEQWQSGCFYEFSAGVVKSVKSRFEDYSEVSYDRIAGLDLSDTAIDGSQHKAPCGGPGTGPNPTDRAKRGWKWSLLCDRAGIPAGRATGGANRHDQASFSPTVAAVEQALCCV